MRTRLAALSVGARLLLTVAADRMSRLMAVEPDRRSVLRRFVRTLDEGDEKLLRELPPEHNRPRPQASTASSSARRRSAGGW